MKYNIKNLTISLFITFTLQALVLALILSAENASAGLNVSFAGAFSDSNENTFETIFRYVCVDQQNTSEENFLYIRQSEKHDAIIANQKYICPLRAINSERMWTSHRLHFSSEFSLSMGSSAKYPVPIEAAIKLKKNENGFIFETVGYAALPNDQGLCDPIQDKDGEIHPSFLLKKFIPLDRNNEKTPIYRLDQNQTQDQTPSVPVGYSEDERFRACAPSL